MERAAGVALKDQGSGVAKAAVSDPAARLQLRWDRYVRLSACAQALRKFSGAEQSAAVLDVGGFDGALALFLPEYDIDVIDPATTGGDLGALPTQGYDIVTAIDVLEHVEPRQRTLFIAQLGRLARKACLVNYPLPSSSTAQKVVATLIDDPFVAEHVRLGLPYSATVQSQFEGIGFACTTNQYASRSVWAAFMALHHVDKILGAGIGRYLVEEHEHDRYPDPLYELLVAVRQ
jgi:hypothetical protein